MASIPKGASNVRSLRRRRDCETTFVPARSLRRQWSVGDSYTKARAPQRWRFLRALYTARTLSSRCIPCRYRPYAVRTLGPGGLVLIKKRRRRRTVVELPVNPMHGRSALSSVGGWCVHADRKFRIIRVCAILSIPIYLWVCVRRLCSYVYCAVSVVFCLEGCWRNSKDEIYLRIL